MSRDFSSGVFPAGEATVFDGVVEAECNRRLRNANEVARDRSIDVSLRSLMSLNEVRGDFGTFLLMSVVVLFAATAFLVVRFVTRENRVIVI